MGPPQTAWAAPRPDPPTVVRMAAVGRTPAPLSIPAVRPAAPAAAQSTKVTIPTKGPGTFVRAKLHLNPAFQRGRLIRYDVRVEKGLPFDAKEAARLMHEILNDKRSWAGSGRWRFELVSSARRARLHAYIATPRTTDRLCAPYRTRGRVSCQNGNRVVLNARRWAFGAKAYGKDLDSYRQYLVNHEFGHALGFGHRGCPGRHRLAPVMMQQTKGLGGCRPNPWPAPKRR